MVDFAVFDMKTGERITQYFSREEAEEKVRELTDEAVSEEDLEFFTQECFAIADEWVEDLEKFAQVRDYVNDPVVMKIVAGAEQK